MLLNDVLEKYPVVTAIVNLHNAPNVPHFIDRALTSVLEQEFDQKWEVIVVNDGEPMKEIVDNVEPYADKFEDKGIKFTFFGTEQESGYQCHPKNVACYHSKGEYLTYLDYDNKWLPGKLQVLYDAIMEGTVWPDFTYGRREYIVDEGCAKKIMVRGKEIELREGTSPKIPWTRETVAAMSDAPQNGFIDTGDILIAKGALWRMQLATQMMWNEGLRRFGDWELIVRGANFAGLRGKAVEDVVQNYYWHGLNLQLTRPPNETPEKLRLQ